MTERLLQYIWQFQYFNSADLETTNGELLAIIYPGNYNIHQGPDFLEGRIKVEDKIWVGNIELHINASDWYKHEHASDRNYANVILHVVWKNDDLKADYAIATLELESRVSKLLLKQYEAWMKSSSFIPCAQYVDSVEEIIWIGWRERLLVERLIRKSEQVQSMLELNNYHWEETLWWMLARNFGLYVNADAFEELARSIPYNLLSRHRNRLNQLEAILLGQAGLLEEESMDEYDLGLQKEYRFYAAKYGLKKY